ncbi:MAG TPA: mechanosensitive ion channel family protein [Candidatus Saccharimonadales bacterium]|nr:mechanosensitive ion channel family protein [Candidatus Saccharimonadales bacterium]
MLADTNSAIKTVSDVFHKIVHTFLSWHSLLVLIGSLVLALLLGRVIAAGLRRVVNMIGAKADKAEKLQTVNRLRRYETMIVLSIAVIRSVFIIMALYFWWLFVHPSHQPSAILGASALVIVVLGNTLAPALRDITSGSLMMAEQWYGVGDHIRVEPFMDMQGVVERVSLRSTRIRGLNGEIIWVNNQNIAGVRISPKGTRSLGIELFVSNLTRGEKLIEAANQRLPQGSLLVISPLQVASVTEVGDSLWHVTAIGETAPGREWLLERFAPQVLQDIDKAARTSVLVTEPIARYADSDAERRFIRTIHNARKRPAPKRTVRKRTSKK